VANLLLETSAVKLGWSMVVVALLVGFVLALRAWWSELGEVEKLSSNIGPKLKHFKHGIKR
jgi:hypothetical protein